MEHITKAPRHVQDRAGRIRTFTGRYVDPLRLRGGDICIEDIAHHLSNLCRYTGACPRFYSVAQHSFLVAHRLAAEGAPLELQMAGLLHDAAEAYFNDLASPVKHAVELEAYSHLEREATRLILCVFGVDPDLLADVKAADDAIFRDEVATWWGDLNLITPLYPDAAKRGFIATFNTLEARRNA